MQATATRLTGTGAGATKYDVLSALALAGLYNTTLPSQRALRFIALITLRYNWTANVLSIGHSELERMWNVSKRTVIREMDALRSLGLLVLLRRGRKGKVSTYRLDIAAVHNLASDHLVNQTTGVDTRLCAIKNVDIVDQVNQCVPQENINDVRSDRSNYSIWETILDRLPDTVSNAQKARWLTPLRIEQISETLEVEVASAFRADYICRAFGDQLQNAARSIGIRRVAIVGTKSKSYKIAVTDVTCL